MQYLYNDGSLYTFMDNTTYEQIELKKEDLLFETEIVSDSKTPEKVVKKEEEVIKFKARRNKD